ncbi:MAG: choice-of-anchor D domain-containing protein [Terracidiphilus sp.]
MTLTASAANSTKTFALQLNAGTPTLGVNATTISFGNVIVGQTAKQSVTLTSTGTAAVTISSISVAGSLFTDSGITAPVTLNPGQKATLSLQFNANHVSSFTGVLTIASNSSQGNIAVNMSGSGVAAPGTLSALACSSGSMSAAGTDACTVSLSAPAGSSGLTVALSSSNATVAVPASVTVPANATSASFSATVSSFTAAQTVTLSANAGGITKTFGVQLNVGGTSTLSINTSSLAFGSVVLNSPATQSVTLTSTGTASVTVNSATLSGAGFSITAGTFPITLTPNQSVTVSIQFDPTSSGAATGQLTISSTSSTNSTATVSLSGTGTPHEVDLSWSAPASSSDPVAGYNVYRSSDGGNTYQELSSIAASQTSYMDSTVASGQAYDYVVKAFDSSHVESSPSNMTSVTIP